MKEAKDVHPLVDNGCVAEAPDSGHVAGQIETVDASRFPVANMSEAAAWRALEINKKIKIFMIILIFL